MNHYSRFSAVQSVSSRLLSEAILACKILWLCQFWLPEIVCGDIAFYFNLFLKFLESYNIFYALVPHANTTKICLNLSMQTWEQYFLKSKMLLPPQIVQCSRLPQLGSQKKCMDLTNTLSLKLPNIMQNWSTLHSFHASPQMSLCKHTMEIKPSPSRRVCSVLMRR